MKFATSLNSRIAATFLIPTFTFGLMAAGTASAANCTDPWVTTAVTDALRRPPSSSGAPECNIMLYNNGHWSSYNELRLAVGTYWGTHSYPAAPVAATPSLSYRKTLDDVKSQIRTGGGNLNLANAVQLVAAGGGNFTISQVIGLVAAGGGNVISNDGASFKAKPNGTLVGNSGGTYVIQGSSLVAAGGGNLVAAGGGNLVAAGGGNLVAAGGGNLVAAGGGNMTPRYALANTPGPSCSNPQLTTALKDQQVLAALQAAGKGPTGADNGNSGLCNPNRYRAGSGWANQGDVNDLLKQSLLCNDPWIGEIYAEGALGYSKPRRTGTTDECNPANYGGGSWSSFADLRTKIQAYKRTHS